MTDQPNPTDPASEFRMGSELVCSHVLPVGTWVMLNEHTPLEIAVLIGTEAVIRVFAQYGVDTCVNGDGDLVLKRNYTLIHQHRGRLILALSEEYLQVVDRESALGQKLIHDELTRKFLETHVYELKEQ